MQWAQVPLAEHVPHILRSKDRTSRVFLYHGMIISSKPMFNFHEHVLPILECVVEVKGHFLPGHVLYTLCNLGHQTQHRMLFVLQQEWAQAHHPCWEHADTPCNIR